MYLGVKFLYECVMGLRKHEGQGAILADEMYAGFMTLEMVLSLTKLQGDGEDLTG